MVRASVSHGVTVSMEWLEHLFHMVSQFQWSGLEHLFHMVSHFQWSGYSICFTRCHSFNGVHSSYDLLHSFSLFLPLFDRLNACHFRYFKTFKTNVAPPQDVNVHIQ